MTSYKIRIGQKEMIAELIAKDGNKISFGINGKIYETTITREAPALAAASSSPQSAKYSLAPSTTNTANGKDITAPMPGLVIKTLVEAQQPVKAGQAVLTIEAMKMENNITAPRDGIIDELFVKAGDEVQNGQKLISLMD